MTRNFAILGAAVALAACKPAHPTQASGTFGQAFAPQTAAHFAVFHVTSSKGLSVTAFKPHAAPWGASAIVQRLPGGPRFFDWRCLFRDEQGVIIGTANNLHEIAEGDAMRVDANDAELKERPVTADCKASEYP